MTNEQLKDFIVDKLSILNRSDWDIITTYWQNNYDDEHYCDEDNDLIYSDALCCVKGLSTVVSGCSKIVLSFNEIDDYIFKIPFKGTAFKESNEEDVTEFNWDTYSDYNCASNEGFYPIKDKSNYCEAEEYVYNQAVEWELEFCFARTFKVAEINGHSIYASERVEEPEYDYNSNYSATSYDSAKRISRQRSCVIDTNMLASFVEYYGEFATDQLAYFFETLRVHDLHCGNIGMNGDQPVILDYSGFDSDDLYD